MYAVGCGLNFVNITSTDFFTRAIHVEKSVLSYFQYLTNTFFYQSTCLDVSPYFFCMPLLIKKQTYPVMLKEDESDM